VTIPKPKQDRHFKDKLIAAEAEGILAWAVAGAVRWYQKRLPKPKDVEAAVQRWRDESNPFKDFLDDCCLLQVDPEIPAEKRSICGVSELRKRYDDWCDLHGEHPLDPQDFNERLIELGCTQDRQPYHDKRTRIWVGIGILGE